MIRNSAPTEQAKVNQNPDTANLPVAYQMGEVQTSPRSLHVAFDVSGVELLQEVFVLSMLNALLLDMKLLNVTEAPLVLLVTVMNSSALVVVTACDAKVASAGEIVK